MRRKDREVTDRAKIKEIIRDCHCCRLGFYDNGKVYIVPLSFGYEEADGKDVFYFHAAPEGRKIDLIKSGQSVGFELDTNFALKAGQEACGYTAKFQSIIGTGKVSFIEDEEEKLHGLQCLMQHYTEKTDWEIPAAMLDKIAIFKLEAEELSCKEHE